MRRLVLIVFGVVLLAAGCEKKPPPSEPKPQPPGRLKKPGESPVAPAPRP